MVATVSRPMAWDPASDRLLVHSSPLTLPNNHSHLDRTGLHIHKQITAQQDLLGSTIDLPAIVLTVALHTPPIERTAVIALETADTLREDIITVLLVRRSTLLDMTIRLLATFGILVDTLAVAQIIRRLVIRREIEEGVEE